MLRKKTKLLQSQLADFALMNTQEVLPGTDQERLLHYRNLIYNIINGALESAYPITVNVLSEEHWKAIVTDFVTHHKCQNPQLLKMPFELIGFVEQQQYASLFEIPFLLDLLVFEWAEMEIHDMPDVDEEHCKSDGDVIHDSLVYSPYFKIIAMTYPIHLLKTHNIAEHKGGYYVLVYRDADCEVNYLQLNQFSYLLLSEMIVTDSGLLKVLMPLLKNHTPEFQTSILDEAIDFIQLLIKNGIVRGFK